MFRPLELSIGLRYTRAKRRNHFISFITLTSMLGIALGVMALLTVLSVMNGFERELQSKILSFASDVTVRDFNGGLRDWQALETRVQQTPGVTGIAPYVQGEALISAGRAVSGAAVRGILPAREDSVSSLGKDMRAGSLDALKPGGFGIVLGKSLAEYLGVTVGDHVTVITPETTVTPAGLLPRFRRFTVVGIFSAGMYQYDRGMAFIDLQDASRLFRVDGVTGLRLKLANVMQAPEVSSQLRQVLGPNYWVTDWTQENANFFHAVQTEKTVMFVILFLIVAVGVFNIVSTLVMVVNDKQADIAILRTLGMSPARVMRIFIIQGTVIGLVGVLLGVAGGVALSLNVETIVPAIEHLFHVQFLSPKVYYISQLPSHLEWRDVLRVSLIAFVLTVLATIYPARRAARTQPAEALRYE
ncbi:lipoprotein-releasing ABC transporter permease subunit [Acidihalobacter ferrooxydans]|uniref:ABC transporter permease n=1 Tax=Acidihalobacter ferrooxydans TaxID=1765967 RepID=A0A1P8UFH1_9GAMM|nr:lipoprotein-releasing ABC transporter permease subunit [Acidihalobacter ferrooxydans]APZ42504.1 ABC transporter permease [Acidihalobacter ferrooxydans]